MWCFFFFKQKTAYEMRISDGSSDVCSSDLSKIKRQAKRRAQAVSSGGEFTAEDIDAMLAAQKKKCWYCGTKLTAYHVDHRIPLARGGSNGPENLVIARSEEHTSELQLLMRISYAVFCLKKKTVKHKTQSHISLQIKNHTM